MNGPLPSASLQKDATELPPPQRQARRYRPQSSALRRVIRYLISDGFSYGIRMEGFSPAANDALKAAQGTFYKREASPYTKYWRVPTRRFGYEGEDLAGKLLRALRCPAKPSELIAELQRAPIDRGAFTDDLFITIKPLHPAGLAVASSHFHEGVVSICKTMGAKWMPHERAWLMLGDENHQPPSITSMVFNLQQELDLANSQFEVTGQFKIEEQVVGQQNELVLSPYEGLLPVRKKRAEEEDDRLLKQAVKQLIKSKLTVAEIEAGIDRIDQGRTDGSKALPHQRSGIVFCASNTGAANFDDMGLGKTQQLLYVASIVAQSGRKLVVAPKQPLESWDNEIRSLFPNVSFSIGTYKEDAEWVVINPEMLHLVEPHASKFAALIVDEAQMIINPKAKVTADVFEIAKSIKFRYVITGTPIVNHEVELLSLLRLTGHPLGEMSPKDFLTEFGDSLEARRKLNAVLHGTWFIRRHKDDVVKLPPKHRRKVALQATKGFMKEYNAIVRDANTLCMHKPAKFNKLAERYKIHCLAQLIRDIPAGDKVIVFTHLKESMHSAVEMLEGLGQKCVWSDGSPSLPQRKKRMMQFRTDPECRFFVGTLDANNAGTNLQAANWVIFLNYPWTAAKLLQAEDRAYRIGQTKEVFIIMPYLPGLYDERNFDRINLKYSRSRDVLEPAEQEESNKKAAAKLIRTIEDEDLAEMNRARGYATSTVH